MFGCSPSGKTMETYTPTFEYTPPNTNSDVQSSVTLGLIGSRQRETSSQARSQKGLNWSQAEPFSSFSQRIHQGFNEILTRRGFTVKERSFNSLEKMTYPYKESTDLVLKPDFQLEITTITLKEKSAGTGAEVAAGAAGTDVSVVQGVERIGGRVTLILIEPLSGERMWERSINISDTTVSWKGAKPYAGKALLSMRQNQSKAGIIAANVGDPGYKNPISKTLEKYYGKILDTAWTYLNPKELNILKKKADELKKKYRTGGER